MRRRWWWILAAVVIVGAPLAWYLGSPLFLNRVVDEAAGAGAGEVARGRFVGADDFHKGSGTAVIVRAGTQRGLRFENFQVTNGPDLYVYLAVHLEPRSRQDVAPGYVSPARPRLCLVGGGAPGGFPFEPFQVPTGPVRPVHGPADGGPDVRLDVAQA